MRAGGSNGVGGVRTDRSVSRRGVTRRLRLSQDSVGVIGWLPATRCSTGPMASPRLLTWRRSRPRSRRSSGRTQRPPVLQPALATARYGHGRLVRVGGRGGVIARRERAPVGRVRHRPNPERREKHAGTGCARPSASKRCTGRTAAGQCEKCSRGLPISARCLNVRFRSTSSDCIAAGKTWPALAWKPSALTPRVRKRCLRSWVHSRSERWTVGSGV